MLIISFLGAICDLIVLGLDFEYVDWGDLWMGLLASLGAGVLILSAILIVIQLYDRFMDGRRRRHARRDRSQGAGWMTVEDFYNDFKDFLHSRGRDLL